MSVVGFPTRRRALQRLGLDFNDRRAVIDAEMRRIDAAMAVLREVKAGLLAEYKKEIQKGVAIISAACLSVALSLVSPCTESVNQPDCGLSLFFRQPMDSLGERPNTVLIEWRTPEIARFDAERKGELESHILREFHLTGF